MKKPPKGASWQRQEASWIPAFAGMTERRGKDQGRTNNRTDEDRTRFPPAPKAPLACEKSARGAERHSHWTNMLVGSTPRLGQKGSGERQQWRECLRIRLARAGGHPALRDMMDSRFRGNDRKGTTAPDMAHRRHERSAGVITLSQCTVYPLGSLFSPAGATSRGVVSNFPDTDAPSSTEMRALVTSPLTVAFSRTSTFSAPVTFPSTRPITIT